MGGEDILRCNRSVKRKVVLERSARKCLNQTKSECVLRSCMYDVFPVLHLFLVVENIAVDEVQVYLSCKKKTKNQPKQALNVVFHMY